MEGVLRLETFRDSTRSGLVEFRSHAPFTGSGTAGKLLKASCSSCSPHTSRMASISLILILSSLWKHRLHMTLRDKEILYRVWFRICFGF